MKNMVAPPLVEVSRVAISGGLITAFGGPRWCAADDECRAWWRAGATFFMYGPDGLPLDIFLDERGFLTARPTWRTSADYAFVMHLYRLPRMSAADSASMRAVG